MGKRFKRTKKTTPVSQYQKWGFVKHVEKGGTSSNNDCIYLGHSFGQREHFNTVLGAIVRKLLTMGGLQIGSMSEITGRDYELVYSFIRQTNAAPTTRTVTTLATDSWLGMTNNWQNDIAAYTAGINVDDLTFKVVILKPTGEPDVAKLELGNMLLDMMFTSHMALQNRTQANDTGGVDRFNKNDITNNPIAGKAYYGYTNGPQLRYQNNTATTNTYFTANARDGLIEFDVNGPNVTADMQNVLKRPAGMAAFNNVKNVTGAMLAPGQIKNSYISLKKTIRFNTYVSWIQKYLEEGNVGTNSQLTFGSFRMYAFEKKVNTGATEEPMSVGYEINTVYRVKVRKAQQMCPPFHLIL